MKTILRRICVSIFLTALMLVASFTVLTVAPSGSTMGAPGKAVYEFDISSSAESRSDSKLDLALAELLKNSKAPVKVYVVVSDREAVNAFLERSGLPILRGMMSENIPAVALMYLDAETISALAENDGVVRIMAYTAPQVEPARTELAREDMVYEGVLPSVEDYDVDEVHGAVAAWELGFTGEGVKIAVIDDGFDMAHPDLQGQQARYESGQYAGWPIAYDDYAANMWAKGEIGGWMADTSTAISAHKGAWVSFDGVKYKVKHLEDAFGNRVMSQSGVYRMGYHPDPMLAALWGGPVAILVVDTQSAGIYDTVYVDVMRDFDFSNDKPCTKGDEISYFDAYDPAMGQVDLSSWDAGDGFADYSGGMVYWISDGINVYPASDWTYGADYVAASGEAVAFMGAFAGTHGTMTSSAAIANGLTLGGQLGGMAPGAKLITIPFTGNVVNSWAFAQWGADGIPGTGDEANVVSNSYGWSDTAIDAGYEMIDMIATTISMWGPTLWFWSTGNGGPGYGTAHSVVDYTSVHVGAGTTMQYRYLLGYEIHPDLQKWGDVIPFSNSGPGRNGKLNAEIIASGAYSLEPAPLNVPGELGTIGDGSNHFQVGSGTSHATPTVAGGAALGYQAYYVSSDEWPAKDLAKAVLLGAADDMHFDPFKQGAGWLDAGTYAELMGGIAGTVSYSSGPEWLSGALYPGDVRGTKYETFPNFILPGESDDLLVTTTNADPENAAQVTVTSELLLRTGSDSISFTTKNRRDVFVDITNYVPSSTDLLKVTMYFPFEQFDPDMNYVSNVEYWLELHDWVDVNGNGQMGTKPMTWELFRYSVDGSDCNYNQIMIKDPIDRTTDGLIVRVRAITGMKGVDVNLQLDYYELQEFPWAKVRKTSGDDWSSSISMQVDPGSQESWQVEVSVPSDAPIGTYGAAVYVDDGARIQCIPMVINVPATAYEFDFGGPSAFDTPYNNDVVGISDKWWRFEVGDWRMFWCLPDEYDVPDESAYLLTSVEWTELPTDINIHVLAPVATGTSMFDQVFAEPYGPGYYEVPIASSDEHYMGAGVFGSYTNTGGPKEVIAAPLGEYEAALDETAPFAIVTRCPLMAGKAPVETLQGSTVMVLVKDIMPESPYYLELEVDDEPISGTIEASYYLDVDGELVVKGGGQVPMSVETYPDQEINQDDVSGAFEAMLAAAPYTMPIEVVGVGVLTISVWEILECPDIDLGLWYDANMNGIAELTEPYWYVGLGGSSETLTLWDPVDGTYLIKVLGYTVLGSPGLFGLSVMRTVAGASITAVGLETVVSGAGTHYFQIEYTMPPLPGEYMGAATFGFMGTDDMFRIEVRVTITT